MKSQCSGKKIPSKASKQGKDRVQAQSNVHSVAECKAQVRYPLLHLKNQDERSGPYRVPIMIDNQEMTMEIDTGAAVSIISSSEYSKCLSHVKLLPCETRLKTCTGGTVDTLGEITVQVTYGDQSKELPLVVVDGQGPSLLGRNWLNALKLNWQTIKALNLHTIDDQVNLLSKSTAICSRGHLGN